ncbi:MAG: TonB-dependent receptor plug domain-containing protein [Candidatus Cloacimonetes bacterium]|nr:TonB-dependent receptor plug domain-containing protein [Candidatus Cloacimonadota bacterium]
MRFEIFILLCITIGYIVSIQSLTNQISIFDDTKNTFVSLLTQSTYDDLSESLKNAVNQAFINITKDKIIAIIQMSDPNSYTNDFLIDELQHILVNRGFLVTERRDLEQLRLEIAFQYAGEVDDTTAVEIGKFAGANIVVIGAIERNDIYRRLRLKAIDTQTAIIVGTASEPINNTTVITQPLHDQMQPITDLYIDNQSSFSFADTLGTTPRHRRYELDDMRVVATSNSESAGMISKVNLEESSRAGEMNLADIMRDISGVNMSIGGRGESNLRIRGFRRESIRIMVDGRPINAGYFGNVNLAEMPIFDISEIHIVKGAISPLYGVNTSGGVVNFVTRGPDDDSWLRLRASIRRNNTQNLQAITSHSFEKWDYWLNISGFRTDGFVLSKDFTPTPSENGGVREFSNNQNFDIQSKLNFTLFDIHSFGFSAGYSFANERNVPSNIYESRYRQFKDLKRWHLSGLGSFQATSFLVLQPKIYYDAYENTYQEFNHPSLDAQYKGLDSILESWTFGVENRLEYILSARNKLYHLISYEKEAYNRKDNQGYLEWTSNSTELYNTSLLFNHKFNTLWQSSISMGVSQSVRSYKEHSWDIDRKKLDTGVHIEPAFSIHYDDFINKVNIAISRNLQYPYLRQLYSNSRGNLELMPEKALKSEIGLGTRFTIENVLLIPTFNIYYNILDDMIDRVNTPRYINQRRLVNAGAELGIRTRFAHIIKQPQAISGVFSLETEHHLDYINLNMNKDYNFYEIPDWTFTNAFYINLYEKLKLSYTMNWSDKMFSPDDNGRLHELPSKTIHNTSISYLFRNYSIIFSLSNLFDLDYQEEWGYPAAGRNFSLMFEWQVF